MNVLILVLMYVVAIGLAIREFMYFRTKNPKYKHEYSALVKDCVEWKKVHR